MNYHTKWKIGKYIQLAGIYYGRNGIRLLGTLRVSSWPCQKAEISTLVLTAALNFTLSSCLESKRGREVCGARIGRVKSGLVISVKSVSQSLRS